MSALAPATQEATETFECFGTSCTVSVMGGEERSAAEPVREARVLLLEWHERFSRFLPDSELSRLNADARGRVPVSPLMAQLLDAVARAGAATGGLVDAMQVDEIERAGYAADLGAPLDLREALALAPARRPARPRAVPLWPEISLDMAQGTVARPHGLKVDSGGLAKGLFADVLARALADHRAFAVNCGGDVRIGGSGEVRRELRVESPFTGELIHTYERTAVSAATSGIGRRSWLDADGAVAHHLLDPSTGRPAFTGVVQVTALAQTALDAEVRAKAALLSGPAGAARWLPDGGVVVLDDGSHRVAEPARVVTLSQLQGFGKRR